ncbi:MAG TPA: HemK2/MTQ2 family protein methyltransferase [Chitinophagaceae bacterium]|nr:HemK2/MTQ2 family protein methyltransferase [Chitinophagaceae bacterium]
MVSSFVKYVVSRTYKPLLVKYLSGTRRYASKGLTLEIPPQVFHPGFFTSTKLLLRNICKLELRNRTVLELGAGSGFIAMQTAKQGAVVTATDINPVAIEYLKKNSKRNGVAVRIIHSDLFDNIPLEAFDIIAINPPYYKKDPQTPGEYAWYCGRKGEYFERLFEGLGNYIHESSVVLMVLCDGCDMDLIINMALQKGFRMQCMAESRNLVEKSFVFHIEKI